MESGKARELVLTKFAEGLPGVTSAFGSALDEEAFVAKLRGNLEQASSSGKPLRVKPKLLGWCRMNLHLNQPA